MATKQIKLFLLFYLLIFVGSCTPKSHLSSTAFKYNISGTIAGSQDGDTVLLGVLGTAKRINTAVIKNSKFKFTGVIPELSMGLIRYKSTLSLGGYFVIEKEPIVFTAQVDPDDKDQATGEIIKAGPQNEDLSKLKLIKRPYLEANKTTNQSQVNASQDKKSGHEVIQQMQQVREQFIKEHPESIAGLYDLYDMLAIESKVLGAEKTLTTLNLFDDRIKSTSLWSRTKKLAELEN